METSEINKLLRERLRNNECSIENCIISLEECSEHKNINDTLIKTLRVNFKDSRQGRFSRTPRGLAAQRRYLETHPEQVKKNNEANKESRKIYLDSPAGKKAVVRYRQSEKGKQAQLRYRQSEKGKQAKNKELEQRKLTRLINKAKDRLKKSLCVFCEESLNLCEDHKVLNEQMKVII